MDSKYYLEHYFTMIHMQYWLVCILIKMHIFHKTSYVCLIISMGCGHGHQVRIFRRRWQIEVIYRRRSIDETRRARATVCVNELKYLFARLTGDRRRLLLLPTVHVGEHAVTVRQTRLLFD
jgi:hypothetical protein